MNCEWGTWGSWESCSATCGGGTEERIRVVDKPPQNGGRPCTGGSTDVQSCSTQSCVPAGININSRAKMAPMGIRFLSALYNFISLLFYNLTAWETTIDSAVAGSQITYVVTCEGPCTQLTASILTTSGDADLYANEDQPPILTSYNCPDCSMCQAITTDLSETCPNMSTQNGDRLVSICARLQG